MGLDLPNLTEALSEIVSGFLGLLRDFLDTASEILGADTGHQFKAEVVYTFGIGETIATSQETQQTLS
jgi:hypothetical protein